MSFYVRPGLIGSRPGAHRRGARIAKPRPRTLPGLESLEARTLPSFSQPVFYDTGEAPSGLAVGDLKGDGKLDLVVANTGSPFVSVYFGNGDGTLQPAVNVNVGLTSSFVAVSDLTGNGIEDLVLVTGGNSVTSLLGDGTGGFTVKGTFPVRSGLTRFAVGDLNHDGIPDLVLPDAIGGDTNGVSIMLGNGDGTFKPPVRYTLGSGYPYAAAIGDLNGDGNPDLVTSDALFGQIKRLLSNGNGTFQGPVSYGASGSPTDVQVGDFDEDGILDVVTANQGTVSYLRGYGNGTFYNPVTYTAGPGAYSVAVADVNHDGHLDLITANPGNQTVSVLLGNGDGTFQSAVQYPAGPYSGSSPYWVVAGDFNGNGFPDLAVTNSRANVVAILLNQDGIGANHFQISAPTTTVAGTTFDVAVTALTAGNNTDPHYLGTVHFTSTDGSARLPQDYTFTPADQGQHTFSVTLRRAGSQTVTVTDTAHASIMGSATVAVTPGEASSFSITGFPSPVTAGTIHTLTVTAVDAYGNTVTDYSGTVHFSSSDPQALLEDDYTFQPGDNGSHVFGAVLRTAGSQAITATDTRDATVTGSQMGILVNPAAADHLELNATSSVSTGTPFTLTVAAKDPFNNTATGYRGTIRFTSSDPRAALPPAYTFTAADAGVHSFVVTLGTTGREKIKARDVANPSIRGRIIITVTPPDYFYPPANYTVGMEPYSVAVGDFNGDGIPDLVSANYNSGTVSVLMGNGDGTFKPAVNYDANGSPIFVVVGDFANNGKLDLVVTNWGSNTVSILLGNGDGTFQAPRSYGVGAGPGGMFAADLNGDGNLDLVTANSYSYNVTVLLGNGDGTFKPGVNYPTGEFARDVQAGDLNGDGIPDLVVANQGYNTVSVLMGNGDGTFEPAVNYDTGSAPTSILLADLTRNGILDVVTADFNFGGQTSSVSVLLGNGDGTFQRAVDYTVGPGAHNVQVGDLNGDGIPDLVTAIHGGTTVDVLVGNGDGTFRTAHSFQVGSAPLSVAVADLNGDGIPDVVAANGFSNNVSVLLNTGYWPPAPTPPPRDGLVLHPAPEALTALPSQAVVPPETERAPLDRAMRLEDFWTMPTPGGLFTGPALPDRVIASWVDLIGVFSDNGLDWWFQRPHAEDAVLRR